jgi:hypothetical protein
MREIDKRFQDKLQAMPAPGGNGCHNSLLGAATVGVMCGLSDSEIASEIRGNLKAGTRRIPECEITAAITRAHIDTDEGKKGERRTYIPKPKPKPVLINSEEVRDKLVAASDFATQAELWELSPYRMDREPDMNDAVILIENIYQPDDILYIGDQYGKDVKTAAEWITWIKDGNSAPYIIPNVLDGKEHTTGAGKQSKRCDAAVCQFKFVLVEFDDNLTLQEQVSFWHSVILMEKMKVVALIYSGGKSIHAWIKCDIANYAEWTEQVKLGLYAPEVGILRLLGADPACQNPARLFRLPGYNRDGKVQKLLYFDPYCMKTEKEV